MPNWKSPEAFQRLLAAMVAAQDMKLDYRKIATYYGEGATYDSIEGRFRIVRREAQTLKNEIENGTRAAAPPRGSTAISFASNGSETITKTPRTKKAAADASKQKKKERVIGGRVTKPGVSSKSTMMENVVKEMKEEAVSSEEGFYVGDEIMGGVANDGYDWMA